METSSSSSSRHGLSSFGGESVGLSVLNGLPDAVIVWTTEGRIVFANDVARTVFRDDDVESKHIDDVFSDPGQLSGDPPLRAEGAPQRVVIDDSDGCGRVALIRPFQLILNGNTLQCCVIHGQTEGMIAPRGALDEGGTARRLFEASPEGIALLSSSGDILDANLALCTLTGYSRDELFEKNVRALYSDDEEYAEMFDGLGIQGQSWEHDVLLRRQDGSTVLCQVTATTRTDDAGALEGVWMFIREITERRRGEEQFRHLVNNVREYAIFMLDDEGHVITWNEGARRIKGYSEDEIVGQHFSQFYPSDAVDAGIPRKGLNIAAREGQWTSEGWRVRKDGTQFWAHVTITALYGKDGGVRRYAKVTRDMTERREHEIELETQKARAEEAKRNAERETMLLRLLQSVATMANDADTLAEALQEAVELISQHIDWPVGHVYWVRPDGEPALRSSQLWYLEDEARFEPFRAITERANFALEESLPGRTAARGKPTWIRNVQEDPHFVRSRLADDLVVRGAFAVPIEYDRKGVAVLEFFSDEEEAPDSRLMEAMVSVGVQLSRVAERERARERRLASERRYRRLFETSRDGILIQASDRTITDVNSAAQEIVGYDRSALLGRRPDRLFAESDQRQRLREEIDEHGQLHNVEIPVRRKDGTIIICEATSTARPDADEESETFYTIFRDVTDRKEMQEALEASEKRYRRLFEESRDAVLLTTPEGAIVDANAAAEELFGYQRKTFLELDAAALYADPEERSRRIVPAVRETRSSRLLEAEMRHADGHTFLATASVTVHRDEEDQPELIQALVRDITERRRLEEQLLEIQDKERMRLGQELHDGVSSRLTAATIKLSTLAAEARKDEEITSEDLSEASEFVQQAGEEARAISHGLSPVGLDGGLSSALEDLVSQTEVRGEGTCTFEGSDTVPDLDEETATHLYRIAQEAVSNAVKHANAEEIIVGLDMEADNSLVLSVQDDGEGYSASGTEGLGMRTMRYRADLIGGSIRIEEAPGGGTMVVCHFRDGAA